MERTTKKQLESAFNLFLAESGVITWDQRNAGTIPADCSMWLDHNSVYGGWLIKEKMGLGEIDVLGSYRRSTSEMYTFIHSMIQCIVWMRIRDAKKKNEPK